MPEIFQKKIFPILALSVCLFLFMALGYTQCQMGKVLEESDGLKKELDFKEALLVEKEEAIQRRDREIEYLHRGMALVDKFDEGKEKVLEDEASTKEGILETVASDSDTKGWWDQAVPSSILDYLTCH